jgi:hypothetical protein
VTAGELLADLGARGLRVWNQGTELRVASDRAAITTHKPALLALLADLAEFERDGTAEKLRAITATLTAEEHQRLAAEAASGDRLAALMQAVLASPSSEEAP